MRAPPTRLALLALALLGPACRHAPVQAAAAPLAWPAPPAAPRVLQLPELELGAVAGPPTGWWRGTLAWLAGVDAGAPDEGLRRPFDVAFAPDGTLLVADPDAQRVLRYAASGGFLADLTCPGRPWGAPVAVAADGESVLVSDAALALVVRWTASGCSPLGAGALGRPAGLATGGGRILVADPPAHQVVVLRTDGTVAARWGELGEGRGQLHFPSDVALSPDGTAFVVDTFNFRVVHLATDGAWLGAFGEAGDLDGGFTRPKGIAVAPDGSIWISDAERDQVLAFDPAGGFRFSIGAAGAGPGALSHPAGLAATRDRLAVADSLNRRIQVYEILGERP